MTVVLRAGGVTDVGRLRTINQDSFVLLPDRDFYVVADGMGGHQGGEVASQLAIETLQVAYRDPTTESLLDAIAVANHRIHIQANDDPKLRGMGTTVVAAALIPEPRQRPAEPLDTERRDTTEPVPLAGTTDDVEAPDDESSPAATEAEAGDATDVEAGRTAPAAGPAEGDLADSGEPAREQLVVANIGDSRAYLFRDGDLIQLTDDHSLVADLVREGRITPEEAEDHPQRNVVTRVVGVYEEVEVDLWPVDPVRGDRVVLCSDGLFNEVGDDQISAVLRRLAGPQEAAAELVRLANEGGGRDNITVIVIDVVEDGGDAEQASAALAAATVGADSDAARRTPTDEDEPATSNHDQVATSAVEASALDAPATGIEAGNAPSRRDRRRARREQRKANRRSRTRFTWRVALFSLLTIGVIGGAFATIHWYGTSTYFVGFQGDEVAIFRGRPGGLLWIDPELVTATDIHRDEVPEQYLGDLEEGRQQSSLAQADRYVSNIERDIIDEGDVGDADEASGPSPTTPSSTVPSPLVGSA